MDELLKAFGPSALVLSLFLVGFLSIQIALRKQNHRLDAAQWDSVEDFLDLFEAGIISRAILVAKIKRVREFIDHEPGAEPFDALLEKAANIL